MTTLLTYAPSFGEPSASPFCTKSMMQLTMAGIDWTPEYLSDPRKMPHAKLPVLRVDGALISDSDNIRKWIEDQGFDLNAGLTEQQRAQSWALIRMVEDHLYFHVVYDRWADETVWPVIRDAYFGDIPKPLRGIVTRFIRKPTLASLHSMGIARFSAQDRLARAEQDLSAIRALLTQPFLFGDKPTAADTAIAPQLGGMMATPVPTLLGDHLRGDKMLVDYVQRVKEATL